MFCLGYKSERTEQENDGLKRDTILFVSIGLMQGTTLYGDNPYIAKE